MTKPPTAAMSDGAVRTPAANSESPSAAAAATTPATAACPGAGRLGSVAARVSAVPETVASVIRASSSSSMTFALPTAGWRRSAGAFVDAVVCRLRPDAEPGGEPAGSNGDFDRHPERHTEDRSRQGVSYGAGRD